MRKISESMEIATWKAIAYRVQQLNFEKGTEQEFQENLASLNKILQELGVEGNIGERTPNLADEIGTASLLQSVQDIHVPNNYKKATFYEKIYQLSDLGVQEIEFCPVEFYESYHSVKKVYGEKRDKTTITKCYTDGEFQITEEKIKRAYELGNYYTIRNLYNANYILVTELSKSSESKMNVWVEYSQAALKNFNGVYPSKEEIIKFYFPELAVATQSLIWGESPRVKEKYESFDIEQASYQKSLKRDSNNQYYYE